MVLQVKRLQAHSRAFCFLYNVKEIHFVCCLPTRVRPNRNGGGERIRTDALLLAKQALSRLSYTPNRIGTVLVGLGRFELPTSRLSGVRSNQAELQAPGSRSRHRNWKGYAGGGARRCQGLQELESLPAPASLERR